MKGLKVILYILMLIFPSLMMTSLNAINAQDAPVPARLIPFNPQFIKDHDDRQIREMCGRIVRFKFNVQDINSDLGRSLLVREMQRYYTQAFRKISFNVPPDVRANASDQEKILELELHYLGAYASMVNKPVMISKNTFDDCMERYKKVDIYLKNYIQALGL